jgi:hypothetical protein
MRHRRAISLRRRAALEAVWGPSSDGDTDAESGAAWRWIARDNPAAALPTDFALVRRGRGRRARATLQALRLHAGAAAAVAPFRRLRCLPARLARRRARPRRARRRFATRTRSGG